MCVIRSGGACCKVIAGRERESRLGSETDKIRGGIFSVESLVLFTWSLCFSRAGSSGGGSATEPDTELYVAFAAAAASAVVCFP